MVTETNEHDLEARRVEILARIKELEAEGFNEFSSDEKYQEYLRLEEELRKYVGR